MLTKATVIWAVYGGIVIASVLALIAKQTTARILKKIVDSGALSKDSALTCKEMGITSPLEQYFLMPGKGMRKYILNANPEQSEKQVKHSPVARFLYYGKAETEKTDFGCARLYLRADRRDGAEMRYTKRGTNIPTVIIGLIFIGGALFLVNLYLDKIILLAENTYSYLSEVIKELIN